MRNEKLILSINNVFKSYHRDSQIVRVLENISLELERGAFLALMGPSGSGKSTLLNLIAGLDHVDQGTIEIDGVNITTLSETDLARWRSFNVGFIFQFYNLIPVLTAFENVELPLLLTGLSKRERQEHVSAAVSIVNMEDRLLIQLF
jgi:putative ABC transport system ATP-binding protein